LRRARKNAKKIIKNIAPGKYERRFALFFRAVSRFSRAEIFRVAAVNFILQENRALAGII
jgi:hypothetical protein